MKSLKQVAASAILECERREQQCLKAISKATSPEALAYWQGEADRAHNTGYKICCRFNLTLSEEQ